MNGDRRTGRTTRMMVDAMQAALDGRTVFVVVHREAMKQYALNCLGNIGASVDDARQLLRFVNVQTLQPNYFRGHSNMKVFVDHYVWESVEGRQIERLHDLLVIESLSNF